MNISRFGPSPTGRLHLGHAYSAVLGHVGAKESGGKFLLRIEDLDPTRSRTEFVDGICEDMEWLGLDWDEPVLVQSQRSHAYGDALDRLKDLGLVYACFCTRADIAAALEAPHGPSGAHYPGTCRTLPDDPGRRASMPHCWRLDCVNALRIAGFPSWTEAEGRTFPTGPADFDDVILARKDAPAAYHLACAVDDAATGVTMVVRGADLRPSTPIQRLLQKLLTLPEPAYLHHALVTHADGRRLAKRDLAPTLAAMREEGMDGRALAADLLEGKLPLGFAFADA
ncbi:MAG TPA: tRNA glutamyl-Q(34) synthetase GluQRS [Sphingomicrobium sp.]